MVFPSPFLATHTMRRKGEGSPPHRGYGSALRCAGPTWPRAMTFVGFIPSTERIPVHDATPWREGRDGKGKGWDR